VYVLYGFLFVVIGILLWRHCRPIKVSVKLGEVHSDPFSIEFLNSKEQDRELLASHMPCVKPSTP
jgi:hypothetical protein